MIQLSFNFFSILGFLLSKHLTFIENLSLMRVGKVKEFKMLFTFTGTANKLVLLFTQ